MWGYITREELQREMLKGGSQESYKNKLEERKEGELARECWKKMRERTKRKY